MPEARRQGLAGEGHGEPPPGRGGTARALRLSPADVATNAAAMPLRAWFRTVNATVLAADFLNTSWWPPHWLTPPCPRSRTESMPGRKKNQKCRTIRGRSYPPGVKWQLDVQEDDDPQRASRRSCAQVRRPALHRLHRQVMTIPATTRERPTRPPPASTPPPVGVKPPVNVGLYAQHARHYIIAFFRRVPESRRARGELLPARRRTRAWVQDRRCRRPTSW